MLSFAVIVDNICWITVFPCLGCVSYFTSKITNLVPSLSYLSVQQFVFCVTPLLRYESNCPFQRYSFGVFLCVNLVLILQQDEKTGEKFCTSIVNQARIRIYVEKKPRKERKRIVNHFANFHSTGYLIIFHKLQFGSLFTWICCQLQINS